MKRNKMAKVLSLFTAALLMTGTAACGDTSASETSQSQSDSQAESPAPAESSQAQEQPVEKAWTDDDSEVITIMLRGDQMPEDNNIVIRELEKQTGTKINMLYLPIDDYKTTLNNMIAAEDLPDIFICDTVTDVADFKAAGLLADMEDVLNAVAPNVMAETGDMLGEISVNQDGVYLVPCADRTWNINVNIRTDWLRNLNLEMPTDLESFAEVMHAFTYDDPDGNGEDDTFGYSFNLATMVGSGCTGQNIFGAFGIAKGHTMEMEDGTVTSWVKHPKFLDAMKYLKGLIDDGVCEPDYISIPNMSMFEKLWNGTAGCMEWECVGPTNNWMPGRYVEDPVPEFGFAILEGPDGEHGTSASYAKLTSGFAFSAKCKNLEGAARIANFCMSEEGTNLLYFGVEGVMYNWVDKAEGIVEYIGEYEDTATHRAAGGYCYNGLFRPSHTAEYNTLNAQSREGVELAWDNEVDWAYITEASQVELEYGSDMNQIISEMFAELLITDVDNMQEVYDSYIAEWENAGGSDWEEEVTALWKAQQIN